MLVYYGAADDGLTSGKKHKNGTLNKLNLCEFKSVATGNEIRHTVHVIPTWKWGSSLTISALKQIVYKTNNTLFGHARKIY